MMELKISTACLDDLFSTQEMRDNAQLAKILDIPLSEIDSFPGHPYQVRDDEEMERLVESIKEHGVIVPATVRQKPDGRYELISGHRRKRGSELAGLTTLRCMVVDIDDDEAIIMMVDSNNYRERFLPSEKAFAYRMKMEALKRRAGRPAKNSVPVRQPYSRTTVANETGESETQIQRYIRLTYLIPPLLQQTDEGRIKLRTAVELSYLPQDAQDLVDTHSAAIGRYPNYEQAQRMRSCDELTAAAVSEIMSRKAAAKEIALSASTLRKHIPPRIPDSGMKEYTLRALEYYAAHISET